MLVGVNFFDVEISLFISSLAIPPRHVAWSGGWM